MAVSQNRRLTDRQFARIARALAEPRRVRIHQEIGTREAPAHYDTIQKAHRISAAAFSQALSAKWYANRLTSEQNGERNFDRTGEPLPESK
jgi:hypothetical protein